MQQYGKVDILINNAAIWYGLNIKPWDTWTVEEWDRIFAVNVRGTWLCCKAIAPLMGKKSRGKIINIASNVARVPAGHYFLPYACTKGTVYTLTHALARALGPSGINVNAIAPGYTATEASLGQRDSEQTFKHATSEQTISRREEATDLVGTAVLSTAEGGTEETVIIDINQPTFRYLTPVGITGTSSTFACISIPYGARSMPVDNNVAGTVTLEQHVSPIAGTI